MHYSDFLKSLKFSRPDWYLTNWFSAVRIAFGRRGLAVLCAAFAILLSPSLLLFIYGVYSREPAMLILVVLSLWGFCTSGTSPSGVGIVANLIVAIVGLVFAVIKGEVPLRFAALIPGLTWIGSCATLGTTASYLIETLQNSESTFQTLVSRGILRSSVFSDGKPIERAAERDSQPNENSI